MSFARSLFPPVLLLAVAALPLSGQTGEASSSVDAFRVVYGGVRPLVLPATLSDQRLRMRQLLREEPTDGYLLRSPTSSVEPAEPDDSAIRLELLAPRVDLAWNSHIPLSLNDGAAWAGRGTTTSLRLGGRVEIGPVAVTFFPQIVHVENAPFDLVSGRVSGRSSMLPPWRDGETSADLPLRFGTDGFTVFDMGQSALSLRLGPVELGGGTESSWWGPGIRNAIVLSNNAPGIPHLFLRTGRPLRTSWGTFEARWLLGTLTESGFFDTDPDNDFRSLNAVALTWRPPGDLGLTLGVARSVMAPMEGTGELADHALDALVRWDQTRAGAAVDEEDPSEQLFSFFWRWVLPENGFEFYGEWARTEVPLTTEDFLTNPHHSQGYTLGLQWVGSAAGEGHVLVNGELTYLEKSGKIGKRTTRGFYTSLRVPHGYTHKGQVVGASIGPGSSSQWVSVDYLDEAWQVGLFGNRIRWHDDSFFTTPVRGQNVAHDVSLIFGIRGAVVGPWGMLETSVGHESRLNFLFQNDAFFFDTEQGVDVNNTVLRISLTPGHRR